MDVAITSVPVSLPPPPPRRVTLGLSVDEFQVLARLVFDRYEDGRFAWLDDAERSTLRQANDFVYRLAELRDDLKRGRV